MADGGQAYPKCGPWLGVKETSTTLGDVVRSLNVSFEDGKIRRRPGRRVVLDTGTAFAVSRIFEHVGLSDSRETLVALMSPDPNGNPIIARISPSGGVYEPITFPEIEHAASPEEFFWSSSYKGGRTIISDPTGRMLVYDGETISILSALQGNDARNELTAARAYLWGTPPASLVLTWRNRIAALRRRTVGLSADAGDTAVPWDAPASGANVWPASTNLDVLTQEGDEIVGASVQADRLACFMRRGVVVVDEDSISPVPRTVDKQFGCVAPRSVVEIGGGHVAYLADGAVCLFDGTRVVDVSEDIRETLKLVAWSSARRAVGVHLAKKQEYRLWLPIRGRPGNRVCVIFDYLHKAWRVYAGWYPWMQDGYAQPEPFDVTAAAAIVTASGEEVLLTGDSSGRIWMEDVGDEDGGLVYPAFAALAPLRDGAAVEKFSDWRIHAEFDGAWVQGMALEHGDCLEQEITRLVENLEGDPPDSRYATVRMLDDLAGHALGVYGTSAWGEELHTEEPRTRRLSVGRANTRSLQPLIVLPGEHEGVIDLAPGGIDEVEIAVAQTGGGRRG